MDHNLELEVRRLMDNLQKVVPSVHWTGWITDLDWGLKNNNHVAMVLDVLINEDDFRPSAAWRLLGFVGFTGEFKIVRLETVNLLKEAGFTPDELGHIQLDQSGLVKLMDSGFQVGALEYILFARSVTGSNWDRRHISRQVLMAIFCGEWPEDPLVASLTTLNQEAMWALSFVYGVWVEHSVEKVFSKEWRNFLRQNLPEEYLNSAGRMLPGRALDPKF